MRSERHRLVLRGHASSRAGFGLIMVLVVVAVIATLAAVIALNLRGAEDNRRIQETAQDLLLLDVGLSAARLASGSYVRQISHLATLPTTADKNSCGQPWTSTWASNWQNNFPYGPFYRKRIIPIGTGFPLGVGHAMDTMIRVPPTTTGAGTLRIRIPDVSENDAVELDAIFDASNGATAGRIRWTAPVAGRVDTLNFIHTRYSTSC